MSDDLRLVDYTNPVFRECGHVVLHRVQLQGYSRRLSEIEGMMYRSEWIAAYEAIKRLGEDIGQTERTQPRLDGTSPDAHKGE